MSDTHDFNDGNGPVPAHRHSNGGGWVAETAKVDASAYVGPDAKVYGNAHVYGNAWVYGYAHVYGNAQVYGDAHVYGYAQVYGDAHVYGYAWVGGNARVGGNNNAAKIAELIRKLDALRNEVKAWRDWDANCGVKLHPNNIKRCSCEGLNRVENVLNARQATDTLNALEDVR